MKKPLFSALYILSLLAAGLSIHQAFAQQRSPSVEPITEISIEENRPTTSTGKADQGFNFDNHVAKRVPANIKTKSEGASTPYSYIGPMIFLLALPFALWIVISKKMKVSDSSEKVDYYPKTFQFKSHKSDYQETDDDEDNHHMPKAS